MNALIESPFAASASADSAAALQVQARENTEVLAMVTMAKRFPRDVVACTDRILNAFTRVTLAETAAYQFSRGGTDVSGPSIRAAEAIAQVWGNLSTGFTELERGVGPDGIPFSWVEAAAWDLESTNRAALKFIVRHWRDTKRGGYVIKEERDIYELIANQAQRRKRACILALVPGDVVEAAMKQVEVTLSAKADTSTEGLAKLVEAFKPFGVTQAQIEKRIQRRLEAIRPAQVVALKRIYASLRDDMSEPADWFESEDQDGGKPAVDMPKAKAKPATAASGADPATGEIREPVGGSDANAAGPAAASPAAAPAAPARAPRREEDNSAQATDGERKMILNRVRSNELDLDELLREVGLEHLVGVADLQGLTKDGFIALKDALPKAA